MTYITASCVSTVMPAYFTVTYLKKKSFFIILGSTETISWWSALTRPYWWHGHQRPRVEKSNPKNRGIWAQDVFTSSSQWSKLGNHIQTLWKESTGTDTNQIILCLAAEGGGRFICLLALLFICKVQINSFKITEFHLQNGWVGSMPFLVTDAKHVWKGKLQSKFSGIRMLQRSFSLT